MNILQITHQIPYPPDSGGRAGIFYLTKGLSDAGHKVFLASLVSSNNPKYEKELSKFCALSALYIDARNKVLKMGLNLLSSYPYNLSKYHIPSFLILLDSVVSSFEPEIVHVDHLHVAYAGLYLKKKYGFPVVLREHNVEATIMERFYKTQRNPVKRWYAYHQFKKLWRYEAWACGQFDLCLPITPIDEKRLLKMNPSCITKVIPAGVDTSFFYPRKDITEEEFTLVTVGTMDWLPNIDGILWFHKNVLPIVLSKYPSTRLYIIGHNPPRAIRSLERQNVIVTGYVPDVREYIAKAAVYVVPLRVGGGMRIKILDAMAMGKAIVSTAIGCEGIEVRHGENILIADNPQCFAECVIQLLESKKLREKIGQAAFELINAKYKWELVIQQLLNAYKMVLGKQNPQAQS